MGEYFRGINDPRQAWKTEHNLYEIIIMTICAVISGFDHWEDIVDFCNVKETWFMERLGLQLSRCRKINLTSVSEIGTVQAVFETDLVKFDFRQSLRRKT